ncbi:MAG TPA: DUF1553 domain-containing protein, partial [Planctomycetota bacterium]|nr:DUF1553 domain-containing protein [Planctomycetota bacterium]
GPQELAAYKLSLFRGLGFPQEFALSVSRQFLGTRLGCARCHDHPYDLWNTENFHGLAAIAVRGRSRVQAQAGTFHHVTFLESDAGDYWMPGVKDAVKPAYPYGGTPGKNDGRFEWLGGLMTKGGADPLDRVAVNRVWSWLTGQGIVEPVDDFSKMNPPISTTLLTLLVKDFRDHKRSIKHLASTICRTQLYQRAGDEPWRGTSKRRATALAANSPALPIVFDAPTSWIRWTPRNGFKFVFRLPDKQKAARHAELDITFGGGKEPSLRGPLDQWILQLANPVTGKTETLAGFGKILTIEVSGTYACEIDSDVPEDERVILASVALADKVYNFRLQGPRETVEDWRDEFITLLKAARPK